MIKGICGNFWDLLFVEEKKILEIVMLFFKFFLVELKLYKIFFLRYFVRNFFNVCVF